MFEVNDQIFRVFLSPIPLTFSEVLLLFFLRDLFKILKKKREREIEKERKKRKNGERNSKSGREGVRVRE